MESCILSRKGISPQEEEEPPGTNQEDEDPPGTNLGDEDPPDINLPLLQESDILEDISPLSKRRPRREKVETWQRLLASSITSPEQLSKYFPANKEEMRQVIVRYPMRINLYYLSLIKDVGDPLWKQAVPDIRELSDENSPEDPLHEESQSPVPNLIHRYPDRVLFLVSNRCAMYCRFCTRKRKVGHHFPINHETIEKGLAYIRSHKDIRDVLLSGGDPLLLLDKTLENILKAVREIPHVEIIRIGTRVPCTLPQRITWNMCRMLKKYHPLYVNVHFNHPDEITEASSLACVRLANAGIPLGCQTVLLRGVNDSPEVIKKLMQKLLTIRVRPYYLYQADLAKGTVHFRTPVEKGLEILESLCGHTSGLCVPHFVIDAPGGGGKIPLIPNYVAGIKESFLILRNYDNNVYAYPICPQ